MNLGGTRGFKRHGHSCGPMFCALVLATQVAVVLDHAASMREDPVARFALPRDAVGVLQTCFCVETNRVFLGIVIFLSAMFAVDGCRAHSFIDNPTM